MTTTTAGRRNKDRLGWRMKFGVLAPSTNTIVEPEMAAMRPDGVTNHNSRIYTPDAHAISNDSFMAGTRVIADNVLDAVDSVMTCAPDQLVMGMSMVTFYGGLEGAREFQAKVEGRAGVGLAMGSTATAEALKAIGGISRIAFVSPYFPAANDHVRRFFQDCGFDVKRDVALQCPSWTAIAEVTEDTLERTIVDTLDGDDVDAIVQVGTNLCMAAQVPSLEQKVGKPVVAINTATYWTALRTNGIDDKVSGFGRLLEVH